LGKKRKKEDAEISVHRLDFVFASEWEKISGKN
jgi:hypothetical protein